MRKRACLLGCGAVVTALLTGCSREDRSDEVAPITEALRVLPKVRVTETYWPPSLKLAERYDATVRARKGATDEQLCDAVLPYHRALADSEFPGDLSTLVIEASGRSEWRLSLRDEFESAEEMLEVCTSAIRLRRLTKGTRVVVEARPDERPTVDVDVYMASAEDANRVQRTVRKRLGDAARDFEIR